MIFSNPFRNKGHERCELNKSPVCESWAKSYFFHTGGFFAQVFHMGSICTQDFHTGSICIQDFHTQQATPVKKMCKKIPTGIDTMRLVGCFPVLKRWVQKILREVGCFTVLKRWAQSRFFTSRFVSLLCLGARVSSQSLINSCTTHASKKEETQRVV
jgi:hypothetical protein